MYINFKFWLNNNTYSNNKEKYGSKGIKVTLNPGTLLLYRYCLTLIFINVDNGLHGPYGCITSALKFN